MTLFRYSTTLPIRTFTRLKSSSSHIDPKLDYTVIAGGGYFVCWHPEPKFPYEHTRRVVRELSELKEGESPLKLQIREEDLRGRVRSLFQKRIERGLYGPHTFDLQNMLYCYKTLFATGLPGNIRPRQVRLHLKLPPSPVRRRGL